MMEVKTKGLLIFKRDGGYSGFMGNLMFQIAATVGIARKNGLTPVFAYTGYYDQNFYSYFKGSFKQMFVAELAEIECEEISETHFHYHDFILDPNKNYNLTGYFQSKRYWEHCEDEIRDMFRVDTEIIISLPNDYYKIKPPFSNTTAIHVRRGDYLKHPNEHPVLPIGYYNKAANRIIEPDSTFIVFSDDIEWCKENFTDPIFHGRISFSEGNSQIADLALMSRCKNQIISNSSFSWWASYLNKYEDKLIIAPKRENWFGVARKDWSVNDLYRPEFIEI